MSTSHRYYSTIEKYHEMAEATYVDLMVPPSLLIDYVSPDGVVVDVGGGTGKNAELLNISAARYFVIDFSIAGLSFVLENGRGNPVVADAALLPLRDASAATVLCSWSLEHFEEPRRVLDEMLRIVRPGGRIIIWGPNWDNIFRKDFPQFAHKSWWSIERVRWNIFLRMVRNEFSHFQYRPYVNTDVAAFRHPEKYISADTDAVHCALCQETYKYFIGKGHTIVHLSDFSEMALYVHNSIVMKTVRAVLKPMIPMIRAVPLLRWFVIRFPIVVERT